MGDRLWVRKMIKKRNSIKFHRETKIIAAQDQNVAIKRISNQDPFFFNIDNIKT